MGSIPVCANFLDLTASEDIYKQNDEESVAHSENSESQQDDDGDTRVAKKMNYRSQTKMTKSEPETGLRNVTRRIRRDLFETYLERNPGMEIKKQTNKKQTNKQTENKVLDELKSNNRHALISQYHGLVQLGIILKKDPVNKQIMATAQISVTG